MKALTLEEVERGIYIDFEGGGNLRRAFLGVLGPAEGTYDDGQFPFVQYLLDKRLRPTKEQSDSDLAGFTQPADLTDVLNTLRAKAENEN